MRDTRCSAEGSRSSPSPGPAIVSPTLSRRPHGGVQVRLSSRASLSLEHHVDVILVRGTIEQSSTFTGGGVPPSTSTQSDRETTFRNGFEWRVRIYRKSVSTQGGN